MILQSQKGSVVLIIAAIMTALSVIVDAVLLNQDINEKVTDAYNEKKQLFYLGEGVRELSTVLLEQFLLNNPNPTVDSIKQFLDNNLPQLIPAPYEVAPVQIGSVVVKPSSVITSGPYKGMNAPITDLDLRIQVQKDSSNFSGLVIDPLELRLSVAYVAMFQFMVLYDTTPAKINTGPEMFMKGRVHANTDICVGGSSGYQNYLNITAGGRLLNNQDGVCGGGGGRVRIATSPTFTTFADMTTSYDHGCTNCAGTGLPWKTFALARWHEQAQDMDHGVQILKLPGAGAGQVQTLEAGGIGPVKNTNNLRFIVDPVLGTDSESVKAYKFAHKADLRIINGVWYLRDPSSPNSWPGIPIWSDHPGSYQEHGQNVGQDDIRADWAARGYAWPAAPITPVGYSYYEYDTVNETIFPDPVGIGIISYGNLDNSGGGSTPQKPGHWMTTSNNILYRDICMGTLINCGGCGLMSVWPLGAVTCNGPAGAGKDPSYATLILNATRGGFRNGHIKEDSPGTAAIRDARSRILPINFDIFQFQQALASSSPGELGSYFGGGRFVPAGFNGIVYISSEWPGGLNGFGGGGPAEIPTWHGTAADATQIRTTDVAQMNQNGLPQPLCSNATTAPSPGRAGLPFDFQGTTLDPRIRFRIPDCANYAAGGAWPNAVRVVNGANLDPGILPKGLSLVSNIPVYLVGNFNTINYTDTSPTSTPWVPSLIAGDKVALVSRNWQDRRSPWDKNPSAQARPALDTTYNTAILSEPSETITVLLEDWTGHRLTVNGSKVFGYDAVYALHDNVCCGNRTYDPPNREFNFDPHFGLITNQPPGTPVYPVSALAVWSKAQ
ncbi:MAG: hypothetical protein AB7F86_14230 [Bdellovibrionales bacterium]